MALIKGTALLDSTGKQFPLESFRELNQSLAMLLSGLPELVGDEEDLARFLTQSSHFTTKLPKPSAFLPSPKDRETSVSRHGTAPLENLWTIGLEAAGARPLYGAAIIKARTVRNAELEVAANEPPPRHAVLRNWPWNDNDRELQKAAQIEKALLLVREASLVMRPATK